MNNNQTGITRNGMNLAELAAELKRQKEFKRDFQSPSENLNFFFSEDEKFMMEVDNFGEFEVNDLFHSQIGTHYKIPKQYYERIQTDYPELLEQTINTHLQGAKEKRLVRTLDGRARAFLSAGYRPMDNAELTLNAVLPSFQDVNDLKFDCQITETRMYIKVITPRVQGEIRKGDVVEAGVVIRNSEVGFSSLSIEPFVNRLVCTNGMVLPDYKMRKFHSGKRNNDITEAQELFLSDNTRMLRDAHLWSEIKDLIRAVTTQASFNSILTPMREAAEREIEGKPQGSVEIVSNWYGFSQDESDRMLDNLIKGKDMTQWGIVNAVTALAHDEEDYDRATELQSVGGQLLLLEPKDVKLLLLPE